MDRNVVAGGNGDRAVRWNGLTSGWVLAEYLGAIGRVATASRRGGRGQADVLQGGSGALLILAYDARHRYRGGLRPSRCEGHLEPTICASWT